MPNTYVDYTATASQTDFAFSFPYLEDAHVVVEIDGVASTAFSIVTSPSTKVVLNAGATVGQKVRVRRDSNASVSFVDFVNGSVLTEKNLDDSYLHNLYLNEEIGEMNERSLQKEVGGTNWDGRDLKLINLADPTLAQDASTKNYTDTQDALKVNKAGDTMSGDLAMGTNKVTGIGDPTGVQDAATKNYVDTTVSNTISGSSTESVKTTFTGAGSASFTFSSGISLDGDTMYEVAIDGVLQEPTVAYAIDADANTITFTSTPPTGSNIVVVQRGYAIPVTTGTVSTSQINDGAITDAKLNSAKLNGIATGATANDTDANLKNRANHTGTSTASTISDFDTEVSNNSSVTANTAKVSNATHTGDVTGSTALTIADNAVTAAKISSTDTNFNINATTGHVGMGVLADSASVLSTSGGTANFQDDAPGGTQAIYVRNTSSTGLSAIVQLVAQASGGSSYSKSVNIDLNSTNNALQTAFGTGDGIGVALANSNGGSGNETGSYYPTFDNKTTLGLSGKRWSVVYAGTASINTSDRDLKEDIQELSEAELRVAQACKGLVRRFKFKGGTRKHIGVIAQDVRDAFSAEGLDAHEYGLFCSDTWTDEDTGEEVTQLGIRYEELLAFIISAL